MSRDLEEIAKSFQELKREDETAAPPFDVILERVSFESSAPRREFIRFRSIVRAAAIALIVAGSSLTFYFREFAGEPTDKERAAAKLESNSSLAASSIEATTPEAYEPAPKSRRLPVRAKRSRSKRRGNVEEIAFLSWRPPTDFLLRSSGEELLKRLPRLGESLTEIEFGSVEEN